MLLASPADVSWFHTNGLQQVIWVMESPRSTQGSVNIIRDVESVIVVTY